jgi:hypothetical protein
MSKRRYQGSIAARREQLVCGSTRPCFYLWPYAREPALGQMPYGLAAPVYQPILSVERKAEVLPVHAGTFRRVNSKKVIPNRYAQKNGCIIRQIGGRANYGWLGLLSRWW